MDKIRDALLRAREDKGFRDTHPVQDLPDAEPEETGPADPGALPVTVAPGTETPVSADRADDLAPEMFEEATAVVLPDDGPVEDTVEPAAAPDSAPHHPQQDLPPALAEEEKTAPDRDDPVAVPGTAPEQVVPIPADSGTLLNTGASKREAVLSKSRFPRVIGTIGFGVALLAAAHFFVEPLDPYLEIGLETVDMLIVGAGPLFEAVSAALLDAAGDLVTYLEGLIE